MLRLDNKDILIYFRIVLIVLMVGVSISCVTQIPRSDLQVTIPDVESEPIVVTPTISPTPTIRPTVVEPIYTPEPEIVIIPTPSPTPIVAPTPTPEPAPELFLEIIDPENNTAVSNNSVLVAGITLPTAILKINSVRATVDVRGEFVKNIPLNIGQNVVEFIVEGHDGDKIRDFLIIRYDPPLPFEFFLLVETPDDDLRVAEQIMQVSGTTSPSASVRVNGEKVIVDPSGYFLTYVQLQPGNNNVKVSSSNQNGKLLTDTRKVFFVP